jgi:predicted MFS family arabinose efflux permease
MVGGGVITEYLGWRWVLFVNVPVALATLVPAPAALPESRNERAPRSLDLAGALTATLGLGLLIYAISEVFLQSMVGIAWLYVLTLYLQEVLGHGALRAGLLFIPMTLASVVAAPVAGRLATRLGIRTTASLGLTLVAVGLLLMTLMSVGGGLLFVLLGMVIGEGGFMLSNVPLTIVGSGSAGEDERGLAAGLLNTSMQLGNAWGLGVVATVVAAASVALSGEAGGSEALVGGLRWGLYACVGFAVLALPVVLMGLPRSAASKDGDLQR